MKLLHEKKFQLGLILCLTLLVYVNIPQLRERLKNNQ